VIEDLYENIVIVPLFALKLVLFDEGLLFWKWFLIGAA
jgi:hypothetical protein